MTRLTQTHKLALLAPRPQTLTEGLQRKSWLRYWTDLRHWTASPTTEEGLCNPALPDQHGLVLTGLTSNQTRAFANIIEATNELLANIAGYATATPYGELTCKVL
jgi:hypothetical protein